MEDTFGRNIRYLRLSVTELCDLRCRYCMAEEGVCKRGHEELCSFEELRDFTAAAAALGVTKLRVTGGEPLVRRGIVELCAMLRAVPGIEELCLTTNGTRLEQLAAPLKAAGVDRLNISLDTLRPERYREITRTGELENVLRAFKEQDANGNGDPNDEIPFTGIGLGMDFLSPFGMTDVYGQRYLVNDDGTVRYAYTSEEYKEGIKWAHKLYQDGLIDNELFTQNDQIRDAKCDDPNVSRVGFCYAWSYDAIFRNWKDEYKVIAPIAGPDGQRYQQGDLNGLYSLKSNQLSITTVCKHPEVVLRWADQFYTGEASIQNFWGGLGEVTTANADGTYTLNNPPAGTSADAWYWDRSLRDFGPKYCSVEFDKKIILDPTEGDGLKVAMDAETAQYVRPCFPELKYTADEYNELSFLQADIDTYVDTTRARWVAEGGIDEEWDAYVEQLKTMGLEDMNKIYEGAYARYLAAQD